MTITHGMTRGGRGSRRPHLPEYNSWHGATQRCSNRNNPKYKDYGGRGIKVCERWLGRDGFKNFLTDMGYKPSPQHSLDRFPNKNGNYEPGNCRWATPLQQGNNKRNNTFPTVRLDPLQIQALKRVADAQGLTIGELVRDAVLCVIKAQETHDKYAA
jgi:hypothetical protein